MIFNRLEVIRAELDGDPLTRGYSGMDDQPAADDLNTEYRTEQADRINPATVFNNVDKAEYLALSNAEKAEVWNLVQVGGDLWVRPGDLARERLIDIFGGGSATIAALAASVTTSISRGEELEVGVVSVGDVTRARAL